MNKLERKKFLKSNKGMTMTEVLMGFVVLILFLGGISGIISFSSNMVYRSVDLKKDMQIIQSELYKKTPSCVSFSTDITLKNVDDDSEVCKLTNAEIYEVSSDRLKEEGALISEEGLGIFIYGIRYVDNN